MTTRVGRAGAKYHGRAAREAAILAELFLGLGMQPQGLDPLLQQVGEPLLREHFERLRVAISRTVDAMPVHDSFLDRFVMPAAGKPA
jgi:hypothetical protein